jgi:dUTP pyrophosphatase
METNSTLIKEDQQRSQFQKVEIPICIEETAFLPTYASKGASGADIKAYITKEITIPSGKSALIPTGISVAIPEGYEIQIRPRSGLAAKHQITVLNTPGTIDSDYRGEISVIMINHGNKEFVVTCGMRIAQLIVAPVYQVNFIICKNLDQTSRGNGGFGHTGSH